MNAPIAKLFGVIVIMFALLIAWTSRWTVFDATALNNNPLNKRTLADDLKIKRGRILADNGEVLAKSVKGRGGVWSRTYPQGSLFAQAIGYSNVLQGERAGLEQSDDSYLRGDEGLETVFGQTAGTQVGDDVYTTLDPAAQREARTALAGREGAVVALNPKTGAVLAMYANPNYDDNHLKGANTFNEATQAYDTPGSTFKIVTAVAALDRGLYTPDSIINGHAPVTVSGVPLFNDQGDPPYGDITLTTAMIYSVDTVFAQVAEHVGIPTMTKYMKRFGFYSKPPLDLPPSQLRASNVSKPTRGKNGQLLFYPPGSDQEDIGRIGIGQGGLTVTPMQMAEVVSAVANGGKLMTPHLTAKVVNASGQTVKTINPSVYSQVMKPSTASEVTQMMTKVVEEGTGTPAQIGNLTGEVAGKTGTAQVGSNGSQITEPWFVAFAPVSDPKVAIAVTVDRTDDGYGATIAAPIAKDVMETLLQEGK
jgi:peptidoglycan glycosyltransferase